MQCSICKKEVPDKGKGFRAFVVYNLVNIFEIDKETKVPVIGKCRHQIRICSSCLKKNYQDINL